MGLMMKGSYTHLEAYDLFQIIYSAKSLLLCLRNIEIIAKFQKFKEIKLDAQIRKKLLRFQIIKKCHKNRDRNTKHW